MITLPAENEVLHRELTRLLREDQVSLRDSDRLSTGRDSNSKAILWAKHHQIKYPPETVVWPETTEEVSRIAAFASEREIALIPFGGGSGVCGGTWALKGGICLDLKRMDRILKFDTRSMTVRAQTGINGEILERELVRRRLTLGHFPSSIYVATLGGYLACRSAGQFSSQYGKIEDMVEGIEVVLADGSILRLGTVRDRAGEFDGKELFVGSEGTLGVITEATLKVHPLPETDHFLGFTFSNLEEGWKAIRQILQAGVVPCVVRLYDELDTMIATSYSEEKEPVPVLGALLAGLNPVLNLAKDFSLKFALQRPRWFRRALGLLPRKCLLILGFQGMESLLRAHSALAERICETRGGINLGEKPGRHWLKHRYSVSYKLSPLFDAGYFADTMEVATTWKNLGKLYHAVRDAISEFALVMAHFSHAYGDGCSIYFTFIAYREGEQASLARYDQIWEQALKACAAAGGTISHHHGVGLLKAHMMSKEWGEAFPWLQDLKRTWDPNTPLNPGKLGFPLEV